MGSENRTFQSGFRQIDEHHDIWGGFMLGVQAVLPTRPR